jgi:hypothetical protein
MPVILEGIGLSTGDGVLDLISWGSKDWICSSYHLGEGSCSGSTMQEESVSTIFKEGYTNVALWSLFDCKK